MFVMLNNVKKALSLSSHELRRTVRDVLRSDNNLTGRAPKQIDRSDSLLSGFNLKDGEKEFPLHQPTGEKTRKTYDFTKGYRK